MISTNSKIYLAGHRGLLGAAINKQLQASGYQNVVTRTRAETDLRNQALVEQLFARERPEAVILSAARVDGQQAVSSQPGDYLQANLAIGLNVIDAARRWGVKKLVYVASPQAFQTDFNQFNDKDFASVKGIVAANMAMAMAKRSIATMCQAYAAQHGFDVTIAVPSYLYGPGESIEPSVAQIVPNLFNIIENARERGVQSVELPGQADEQQDFLYVDDAASALVKLLSAETGSVPVAITSGQPTQFDQLAANIARLLRFEGELAFSEDEQAFMPYSDVDTSMMSSLGWKAKTSLSDGLQQAYHWWVEQRKKPVGFAGRAAA
ncbi:MAG: NAD-dependent epimerase/dehydratase family protein [Holosporaceae bacterium]